MLDLILQNPKKSIFFGLLGGSLGFWASFLIACECIKHQNDSKRRQIIENSLHGCVSIKYRNTKHEKSQESEANQNNHENEENINVENIGSGFYFRSDLFPDSKKKFYVLTNHHNIDSLLKKAQEESLNIKFKTLTTEDKFIRIKNGGESAIDGKVHYYNAKLVYKDKDLDLALLEVNTEQLGPVVSQMWSGMKRLQICCDITKPVLSDIVYAIGCPGEYESTVTSGIISQLGRSITQTSLKNLENMIQTDASINQGNSGGPLITADGIVAGINTRTDSGTAGISFASNWINVKTFLDDAANFNNKSENFDHFGLILSKNLSLDKKDDCIKLFPDWERVDLEQQNERKRSLKKMFCKEYNKNRLSDSSGNYYPEDPEKIEFKIVEDIHSIEDFGDLVKGSIIIAFKYKKNSENNFITESDGIQTKIGQGSTIIPSVVK